jgi:hypothetical protein
MLTALLLAAAVPAPPPCPIERAVYRLHGAPAFSAGFARQERRGASASDLAFWVKTPLRTYWFSFGSPNGYGGTFVSPGLDPRRTARMSDDELYAALDRLKTAADEEPLALGFHAFDGGLGMSESAPATGSAAPALIFVPDIGRALWYQPAELAGGDESARDEAMPTGFFEPAGCDGPPR